MQEQLNGEMFIYAEKQRKIEECNSKIEKLETTMKIKKAISSVVCIVMFIALIYIFFTELQPLLEKSSQYSDEWQNVYDSFSTLGGGKTLDEEIMSVITKMVVIFIVAFAVSVGVAISARKEDEELKKLRIKKRELMKPVLPAQGTQMTQA